MKRVLVVDGLPARRKEIVDTLCPECEIQEADDPASCRRAMLTFGPQVVLLSAEPDADTAIALCTETKQGPISDFVHVIIFASERSAETRRKGYAAGADDVLDLATPEELRDKIDVYFRNRERLERLLENDIRQRASNQELQRSYHAQTKELLSIRSAVVFLLAELIESRDGSTGRHLTRIRSYSQILSEELAESSEYADQINSEFVDAMCWASPLHDVGKMAIPDSILLKPGKLTPDEFRVMQGHCEAGAQALEHAVGKNPADLSMRMAIAIARHHHERFNGKGYPSGLADKEIPLSARIVALCDVFDALTMERVYKPAMDPAAAREMIQLDSCSHFDPVIVSAFERRFDEFVIISSEQSKSAPEDEDPLDLGDLLR